MGIVPCDLRRNVADLGTDRRVRQAHLLHLREGRVTPLLELDSGLGPTYLVMEGIITLADCLPMCLLIQVEKGGKRRKIRIRNA